MFDYFLGFDSYRVKHTFSYVSRDALIGYFRSHNISYTLNINDDFRTAIVPSGMDYFSFYAVLHKKNAKVAVIANSNISDFQFKRTKKGPILTLSLDAINYYRKADELLLFFDSQKEFLSQQKIETPTKMIPLMTNDYVDTLPQNQKDAFLRYYQLNEKREIIVSYGVLTSKETVNDLRAVAMNSPEKDFLFFGDIAPEAMKQGLLDSITGPKNIRFLHHLPEELYPSFLYNTKRLLLVGDYLSFPQIMIDCIHHSIPIITYKMDGFREILNENDAYIAKLYSSLYDVINKPIDSDKIQNAKNTLERLKSTALNTTTEKTTIL